MLYLSNIISIYNYELVFMLLISVLKINKNKALLKALPYAFSGFSTIFVGYILINIFLNYPPKMIGISP